MLEADYATTEQAHNTQAGDDQLLVRFFIKPRQDMAASEDEGRPVYKDTEYVSIIQPGNKDSIIERPASQRDKKRFPRHYSAFKQRTDDNGELIEGTPLEEWPGITRSQVEELRYFKIRTVDQLVNIADSAAQNIMGVNVLKERARKFLQSRDDDASAAEIAERDAKIEEQASMLESMATRLEALELRLEEAGVEEEEEEYEEDED